ncbi:hypothetical protein BT93_J1902 [Corymbia citriodora subsp. variegata]|nr:hypothetical protein BT93_J1902 [Corymbia citriodora subsp. variegata]
MGCCYSRVERQEMVSRCRARKRYMKQFVKARQGFSASHAMYLRSLRNTGSALLQFANGETTLHLHHRRLHSSPLLPSLPPQTPPPPPTPPAPPPPLSPSSDTWTSTSATGSSALPPPSPPPPPPPPPPAASGWDFWDPFMPASSRPATEEEWEATTTVSELAAPPVASMTVVSGYSKDSNSELAMVVSRNNGKDLMGIIKELDEYFLNAADAGADVSLVLEVSSPAFSCQSKEGKVHNYIWNLSPSLWTRGCTSPKSNGFDRMIAQNFGSGRSVYGSHCSTAERIYAWEKKLYKEVKDAETFKMEHDKKVEHLRKLELKRADYMRTEKTKMEVEKLESQMMVACQAIETTSAEIVKLRDTELYPQLLELVKGLMCMWRSMYECHQVQTHIVQQLKYLNIIPSAEPTSEIHRQSTLQLELRSSSGTSPSAALSRLNEITFSHLQAGSVSASSSSTRAHYLKPRKSRGFIHSVRNGNKPLTGSLTK